MTWIHPFWAFGLPLAGCVPLGLLMARLLDPSADREGKGIDAVPTFLARLCGRAPGSGMNWRQYAVAFMMFNAALFAITFGLLYAQQVLPLNPDHKGSLGSLGYKDTAGNDHPGADTFVVFNTVCSFVTNTNLQHYSGEQHLSYLSQLACVVWMQFVTPAAGLAIMLATIRGLRGDSNLGNFYQDLMRSVVLVLIPLSLILAICLVATGVPMTFEGAAKAATIDAQANGMPEQTIARGPVAAEVAIKQLGTNGGGFFGPNSAHPFENPSPWSNLFEIVAITLVPMASIVMAGQMLRNLRHAAVIFGVMLVMVVVGAVVAIWAETRPNNATNGLPIVGSANMEGKEVRIGAVDRDVQRLRQRHARQLQPDRRHGSVGPDDDQCRV